MKTTARPRVQQWLALLAVIAQFSLILGAAIMLKFLLVDMKHVLSPSMAPTLQPRDLIVMERWSPRLRTPHRGDVITFRPPERKEVFVKRVVALPGETIEIREGSVWIDGAPLIEPYIAESPDYEFGPFTVPPDHLFVLGDNRNDSHDSHVFGPVPRSRVQGRMWAHIRTSALFRRDASQ